MRGLLIFALGAVVFVAITFLEQIPILGWIGGAVSVAAWIWLTRLLVRELDVITTGLAVPWAAALGAGTGFIGALAAWTAQTGNLFGFTTPPGDRFGAAFGFVGASLGLFYWPVVGALVCAGAAVAVTGRRWGGVRGDDSER